VTDRSGAGDRERVGDENREVFEKVWEKGVGLEIGKGLVMRIGKGWRRCGGKDL
jgi:hypothetical protein